MAFSRIAFLLTLLNLQQVASEQPSAPSPIGAPLRELPWGQLNFLHTTDVHGWFAGHLQEAQYAADWGDYISFANHLRKRADDEGTDLLVIDTGDRVEGNGLYDASDPKGAYTVDVLKEQHIDVIVTGNHELYKPETSIMEYEKTLPNFKNSYIASNLDIHDPTSKDGKLVPMSARYRKFTTKNQGIRVVSFGFIFNFNGNANNTVVQRVEDTVKEEWFQDAIREKDVDLFLIAGHVPVRGFAEYDTVYKAIRDANWDTPIVFFGGHTHIRDYRKWESKAYGLESGRYMETLGFLSISGLTTSHKTDSVVQIAAAPDYRRLYIDNNLYSLHHHSKTNASTFPTEAGKNVSAAIHKARKDLKLDETFGCVPRDLWLNRAPYPSNNSILTWLEKRVLPETFGGPNATESIVITNTGALRFDLFKGRFTVDSTFLVSPFTSGFQMIKDVPYGAASQVLKLLNNEGQILLEDLLLLIGETVWDRRNLADLAPAKPPVRTDKLHRFNTNTPPQYPLNLPQQQQQLQLQLTPAEKVEDPKPTLPGYTTSDDAGDDGDDTIHTPIDFYPVPNCIAANVGFEADQQPALETVDLVFNDFIQDWVLVALRFLGLKYGPENTTVVLDGKPLTDVISEWVAENWKCE